MFGERLRLIYSQTEGIWSEHRSNVANAAPSLVTKIPSRNWPIELQPITGANQPILQALYYSQESKTKELYLSSIGVLLEIISLLGCKAACAGEVKPCATQAVCTIYTVLHTLIDVHRSYVPFWLLGVVGAGLRPDMGSISRMVFILSFDDTRQAHAPVGSGARVDRLSKDKFPYTPLPQMKGVPFELSPLI
jgi:hypothetical protein